MGSLSKFFLSLNIISIYSKLFLRFITDDEIATLSEIKGADFTTTDSPIVSRRELYG